MSNVWQGVDFVGMADADTQQYRQHSGPISYRLPGPNQDLATVFDTTASPVCFAEMAAPQVDGSLGEMNAFALKLTCDFTLEELPTIGLDSMETLAEWVNDQGAIQAKLMVSGKYLRPVIAFPLSSGPPRVISNRAFVVGQKVHLEILISRQYSAGTYGQLLVRWNGGVVYNDSFVRTGTRSFSYLRLGAHIRSSLNGARFSFQNVALSIQDSPISNDTRLLPGTGGTISGFYGDGLDKVLEIPPDDGEYLTVAGDGNTFLITFTDPVQMGVPAGSSVRAVKLMARIDAPAVGSGEWAPELVWRYSDPVNGSHLEIEHQVALETDGFALFQHLMLIHPSTEAEWNMQMCRSFSAGLGIVAGDSGEGLPSVRVSWFGVAMLFQDGAV